MILDLGEHYNTMKRMAYNLVRYYGGPFRTWNHEDVVHGVAERMIRNGTCDNFQPGKGKATTYLYACINHQVLGLLRRDAMKLELLRAPEGEASTQRATVDFWSKITVEEIAPVLRKKRLGGKGGPSKKAYVHPKIYEPTLESFAELLGMGYSLSEIGDLFGCDRMMVFNFLKWARVYFSVNPGWKN